MDEVLGFMWFTGFTRVRVYGALCRVLGVLTGSHCQNGILLLFFLSRAPNFCNMPALVFARLLEELKWSRASWTYIEGSSPCILLHV